MGLDTDIGLAGAAADVLAHIEEYSAGTVAILRKFGYWTNVVEISEGKPTRFEVDARIPDQSIADEVANASIDMAIRRLWSMSGKHVYALHPLMLAELARAKSDELPGVLFDYLPHANPLVLFAEPIPTTTSDGLTGRVLGFHTFGRLSEGRTHICSTDDEGRSQLGLVFITQLDEGGDESLRVSVPTDMERFTVEDAIERTLDGFRSGVAAPLGDGLRDWMREQIGLAIRVLVYMCTEESDIAPSLGPVKRRNVTKDGKPVKMLNVGWKLGPALHRARAKAADASSGSGSNTGSKQVPHRRGPGFQTYWTGAGRTTPIVRFKAPYYVNVDDVDMVEAPATISPVRRKSK
ncbi:hypothetical protein [Nocardia sp. NPDC050435]|uniref:hypothetical protein n=1 Tax=Nocardia sp. NPDC050435 TaxID=3155040 RepID=UPI0033CF08E4